MRLQDRAFGRCRVENMTGQRCHYHQADYKGAPRCGWRGVKIARETTAAKRFKKKLVKG